MFSLFRYSEHNILKVLEKLDKKSRIKFDEYELIQKEFSMLDAIDNSKLLPDEIHKLKVLISNGIDDIIKKYKK